jgi:hypothetical protein
MDRLTQHVRPVGAHEGRDLDAVPARHQAGRWFGLGADGIDAGVGAATLGLVHDRLVDILLQEIDGLRSGETRQRETFRNRIDGDDAFGAEQECRSDRKLSDRTAAPDRDGFAAFQVAEFRAHIASRENIGEEQHLLIAEMVGTLIGPTSA